MFPLKVYMVLRRSQVGTGKEGSGVLTNGYSIDVQGM